MADSGTPVAPSLTDPGYRLTPVQEITFSELLAVGGPRPTTPVGLVAELADFIVSGTRHAVSAWTESRLWISKSDLVSIAQCEGAYVARKKTNADGAAPMFSAVAVGIVAHRAIQIAHTHRVTADLAVTSALESSLLDDPFSAYWKNSTLGQQSDDLMKITSRVVGFLDSWPRLDPTWTPRFEESVQAKIGKLTLSTRPDFILGRPRPDGKQTMFLCDIKSGGLYDHHYDEAQFYALVATLRNGVAPFRSTVYSLASGEYTDPDVTAESLRGAAEFVVSGVNAVVAAMLEQRELVLRAGDHCRYCPIASECVAPAQQAGLGNDGDRSVSTLPTKITAPVLTGSLPTSGQGSTGRLADVQVVRGRGVASASTENAASVSADVDPFDLDA